MIKHDASRPKTTGDQYNPATLLLPADFLLSVVEFSSRATPQPFLDPSILQTRNQMQRQWEKEQSQAPTKNKDATR